MAATLELVIKASDHASGVLRGVDKEASGLSKTLGTGLKVAGVAAGAGILATAFAAPKFISAAADLNESINKSNVVFGDAARKIEAFAATSAKGFGIAKGEAFAYAGTLGTILKGSGLTQDASAEMSTELVKLAADMASFNNIPIDQALEKIRAGLVGESEPLRTVGVLLSEAAVQEEAYATGIAKAGEKLTDQQKVQARYSLILKQTADTQGDFARTSDSLANQQRILGAEWKNLQAILGGALLPIVTRLAQALTKLLTEHEDDIQRAVTAFSEWADSDAFPFLERAFTQLAQLIKGIIDTGIIQWLAKNKEALIAVGIALGVLVLAFGGPIPIIIALIAAGTLLLAHWDEIKTKVSELWQAITERFNAIIESAKRIPILGEIFEGAFNAIRIIVETHLKNIIIIVETAINTVRNIIAIVTALIHGDWDAAWNGIKQLFADIWEGIVALTGNMLGGLRDLIWNHIQTIKGVIGDALGQIRDVFANHWQQIVLVALAILFPPGAGLFAIATNMGGIRDQVAEILGDLLGRVASIAGSVGNAIAEPFAQARRVIDRVIDKVNELINAINSIPSPGDIFGGITGGLGSIVPHALGGVVRSPLQLVGERGPELAALPIGTRIFPAQQTAQMLSGGGNTYITNNLHVQTLTGSLTPAAQMEIEQWLQGTMQRIARA